MIRPLEYCLDLSQLQSSIATIDQRIQELIDLRALYSHRANTMENTTHIMTELEHKHEKK